MPKPEWGVKRSCASCGARFYDLAHDPIVCPECGATFEIEALSRPKRARPLPRSEGAKKVVVVDDAELPEVIDDEDEEIALTDVGEADEDEDAAAPPPAVEEDEALDADEAVLIDEEDVGDVDDDVAPLEGFDDEDEGEARR